MNKYVLSALLLLAAIAMQAATQVSRNRLSGPTVKTGAVVQARDNRYNQMQAGSGWMSQFANHKARGLVTLGVNPASKLYVSQLDYTFNLEITSYNASGASTVTTTTLSVSYKADASTNYKDRSTYTIDDAYRLKVKVLSITDNLTASTITDPADNLFLEAVTQTERYFTMNLVNPLSTNLLSVTPPAPGSTELTIQWGFIEGAEEYDLEWTWVNDYTDDFGTPASPNSLPYDFSHNATRITTPFNNFKLPLVFERGYLLFRVRGVGRAGANFEKHTFTPWTSDILGSSSSVSSFINALGGNFYYVIADHEGDKNWQFSSTYAEEGKHKAVVSYFDGSLRNRQSVTKSNSDDNAIVGETVYDFQGRGAIQVLPVPVAGINIKYYGGFNVNNNTTPVPYSWKDFDKDVAACSTATPGMKPEDTGASHYYSEHSDYVSDGFHSFVPDAKEYPFTQVEYTPDNTGRIRRQSGVGFDHKLGSGHETQYFYSKPNQPEMDRLFGSEVGYSAHYKKNMVVDANGQVSVSYLDQQGRVIATALAGEPPANLQALTNNNDQNPQPLWSDPQYRETMTVDLLNKENVNDFDTERDDNKLTVKGDELVFTDRITVTNNNTPYIFNYDITASTYTAACLPSNICYDCIYDMEIKITDGCGTVLGGGTHTIGNFTVTPEPQVDVLCEQDPSSLTIEPIALTLDVGDYTVYKTLRVNHAAMEKYLENYLTQSTCVKTKQQFIDEELNNIDTSGCFITCQSCLASLGTEANFIANGGTPGQWAAAVAQCTDLCRYKSQCDAFYGMMLGDMYPNMQYGEYMEGSTINPAHFPLSVYNESNLLPESINGGNPGNWRFPDPAYKDDDGSDSRIYLSKDPSGTFTPAVSSAPGCTVQTDGSNFFISPKCLANVSDFIRYWKNSWATSLVKYHPEYCSYEWCKENGEKQSGAVMSSDKFDSLMVFTETLSQVGTVLSSLSIDLLNPANDDPYFNNNGQGVSQKTGINNLEDRLCNYTSASSQTISIWGMADIMVNCGTLYSSFTDISNCFSTANPSKQINCALGNNFNVITTDKEWVNFRDMYLSLKQQFQAEKAVAYTKETSHYCFYPCIDNKNFNPYHEGILTFNFPIGYQGPYLDPQYPCNANDNIFYRSKVRRFLTPDRIAGSLSGNPFDKLKNNTDHELFLKTGQCPNARDLQLLLSALAESNKLTSSSTGMKGYPAFTKALYDELNTLNSISSSPYYEYSWSASTTSATLSASFLAGNCGVTLNFNPGSAFNWNNYNSSFRIERFKLLKFLSSGSGTYSFSLIALVDNDMNSVTPAIEEIMNGTTCIPLNCTFTNNTCIGNAFAISLQNLMSNLASNTDFFSTGGVNLETSPHEPFFIGDISSYLGAGQGQWYWKKISGIQYKIYDNASSNPDYIDVNFNSAVPSDVVSFSDITSDPANAGGFYVLATNGSTTYTLTGTVFHVDIEGMNFTDQNIPAGTCIPTRCTSPEQIARQDLEKLLSVMVGRNITNSQVLDNNSGYTSLIRSFINTGGSVSASDVTQTNNISATAHDFVCDIKFNADVRCKLDLHFTNQSRNTSLYSFANITSISDLVADFSKPGVSVTTNHFTAIAHFSDGHMEMLSGSTTCIPIANCDECDPNAFSYTFDFDSGASFTSDKTAGTGCPGLTEYVLLDNTSSTCSNIVGKDHTNPGTGKFMATQYHDIQFNGVLWQNGVSTLAPNTNYSFSAWYKDASGASNPPVRIDLLHLELYANNQLVAKTQPLSVDPGVWKNVSGVWNSGAIASANTVTLQVKVVTKSGPDYPFNVYLGLDDITFRSQACEPTVEPEFPGDTLPDHCKQDLIEIATVNGEKRYEQYIEDKKKEFRTEYIAKCIGKAIEHFNMTYTAGEYHFTLYYYDQAGNLVRTVPPQGVQLLNASERTQAKADRAARTQDITANLLQFTAHKLYTTYKYNSLNQLVRQETPDGGISDFFYDALGRLVVSQNAKQLAMGSGSGNSPRYSYTHYDLLGRISEVGQITHSVAMTDQISRDPNQLSNWFSGSLGTDQITKTIYDIAIVSPPAGFTQDNLRTRVSQVNIDDDGNGTYEHATWYTYDIHGNVKSLIQENPSLASLSQQYKRMDYKYDLVSGNVNEVNYQQGKEDEFNHRYAYDADNRIRIAFTTTKNFELGTANRYWDRDAKYFYYRHGPLARTEIGHNKVQGHDYAYTIQGWIKGCNSNILHEALDMARDGDGQLGINPNKNVTRDAFGYTLNYFTNDYSATGGTASEAFLGDLLAMNNPAMDLFNGNIKEMATAMYRHNPGILPSKDKLYTRQFQYDQLNRLISADAFTNGSTTSYTLATNNGDYHEDFKYDHNGNIRKLNRNGIASVQQNMDGLTYYYYTKTGATYNPNDHTSALPSDATNKLAYVDDAFAAIPNPYDDIEDQQVGNYTYDEIGNLKSDAQEEISTIEWNVYGKIKKVIRNGSSNKSNLEFRYDATGNRVAKIVKPVNNGVQSNQDQWTFTYYVRDASGNVMATYERRLDMENPIASNGPNTIFGDFIAVQEQHIYGSSRAGLRNANKRLSGKEYSTPFTFNGDGELTNTPLGTAFVETEPANEFIRTLGQKNYEMGNHLGNVLVVVSDHRIPIESTITPATIDYYIPDAVSSSDYYAFGSEMPGRTFNSNSYRYSINGQEKTDEISGSGNHTTALYWEYDTRLGRRWNLDPVRQSNVSDYAVLGNNPINVVDPIGDKPTPKEAAKLADDVYRTSQGKYKPGEMKADLDGWELSTTNFQDVILTDPKTGFNSAIYQRKTGEDKKGKAIYEYAYVTEGTDPFSAEDWENNAQQALGQFSPQYDRSVANAKILDDKLGDKVDLSFAGHSLGGGLASANALATGRDATTFNAAGISNPSRNMYGGLNRKANIQAYVVEGEAVHMSQSLLKLKAEGKITFLSATYLPHIPWFIPGSQKANIAITIANTIYSVYNHTMGSVMDKMDEQGIK